MTGMELKARREGLNLSLEEFAQKLECTVMEIQDIESSESIPFPTVFDLALKFLEQEQSISHVAKIIDQAERELIEARKRRGIRITLPILNRTIRATKTQ